jgi:hypothetical protein
MHESYQEKCAPIVDQRWQEKVQSDRSLHKKRPKVNFTVGIAREIFAKLPEAERDAIAARAKMEAANARATYKASLTQLPPSTPQARQEYVVVHDCLSSLVMMLSKSPQPTSRFHQSNSARDFQCYRLPRNPDRWRADA